MAQQELETTQIPQPRPLCLLPHTHHLLFPLGASQTVLVLAAQNSAISYQLRHLDSRSSPGARSGGNECDPPFQKSLVASLLLSVEVHLAP